MTQPSSDPAVSPSAALAATAPLWLTECAWCLVRRGGCVHLMFFLHEVLCIMHKDFFVLVLGYPVMTLWLWMPRATSILHPQRFAE